MNELDENTRCARVTRPPRVPFARISTNAAMARTIRGRAEDVYRLGERLGYRVNAMWTPDEPTRFDVVFAKTSAPEPEPVAFASLRRGGSQITTRDG